MSQDLPDEPEANSLRRGPVASIRAARQAERDLANLRGELDCERDTAFDVLLGGPVRAARGTWYGAWGGVADAAERNDMDGVCEALAAASGPLRELWGAGDRWKASSLAWLQRFRQQLPDEWVITAVPPVESPPPLHIWARLVEGGPRPGKIMFSPSHRDPLRFWSNLLRCVYEGATAQDFADLLHEGGAAQLRGIAAVMAVSVVPPDADERPFRAIDLPGPDQLEFAYAVLFELSGVQVTAQEYVSLVWRRWLNVAEPAPAQEHPPNAADAESRRRGPSEQSMTSPQPLPPRPAPQHRVDGGERQPGEPDWILTEFRQQQQKLLRALWGKGLVSEAELIRTLEISGGTDPAENLKRCCGRTSRKLSERFHASGGQWTISQKTVNNVKHRRLERLDPQNGGQSPAE